MQKNKIENKAQKLWQNFSSKPEENFWFHYQILIKKSRKFSSNKVSFISSKTGIKAFHPHFFSYFKEYYWVVLTLPIFLCLFFGWPLQKYFILLGFFSIFALVRFWTFNSLELTPNTLVIKKRVFFYRKELFWDTIQSITIQESKVNDKKLSTLNTYILILKTASEHRYRYHLLQKDHQAFLKVLQVEFPGLKIN